MISSTCRRSLKLSAKPPFHFSTAYRHKSKTVSRDQAANKRLNQLDDLWLDRCLKSQLALPNGTRVFIYGHAPASDYSVHLFSRVLQSLQTPSGGRLKLLTNHSRDRVSQFRSFWLPFYARAKGDYLASYARDNLELFSKHRIPVDDWLPVTLMNQPHMSELLAWIQSTGDTRLENLIYPSSPTDTTKKISKITAMIDKAMHRLSLIVASRRRLYPSPTVRSRFHALDGGGASSTPVRSTDPDVNKQLERSVRNLEMALIVQSPSETVALNNHWRRWRRLDWLNVQASVRDLTRSLDLHAPECDVIVCCVGRVQALELESSLAFRMRRDAVPVPPPFINL